MLFYLISRFTFVTCVCVHTICCLELGRLSGYCTDVHTCNTVYVCMYGSSVTQIDTTATQSWWTLDPRYHSHHNSTQEHTRYTK